MKTKDEIIQKNVVSQGKEKDNLNEFEISRKNRRRSEF